MIRTKRYRDSYQKAIYTGDLDGGQIGKIEVAFG